MATISFLYSSLMTSLLKAFSRNWTGRRSSTRTGATQGKHYGLQFWLPNRLTPFLVAHREYADLRVTTDQSSLKGMALLIFERFLPNREAVLFRRVVISGYIDPALSPVRLLVDYDADGLLKFRSVDAHILRKVVLSKANM